MANTSNNVLSTNFNVFPYYDDYDATKGFYRIPFKPGYAVQARELTQIQTMQQEQVKRVTAHLFREGSIVSPGAHTLETGVDYVKIKDKDSSNNDITDVSLYNGMYLTSATNNVKAYVINTVDGIESDTNTKTLYIRYKSSSSNGTIKTFQTNETLVANNGLTAVVVNDATPTGKGTIFSIQEGSFFAKGFIISFPFSEIVVGRYTSTPNARVGFDVTEDIIDAAADASLLDPALESSNYAAPGADRLKLTPTLTLRELTDTTAAPDFIELFTIKEGVVVERYERSQYAILGDELAKRTFDESGDYYVRGLNIRMRENLDTGTNGGYSANGNTEFLSVGVEPGIAYVKGHEINKLVTDYIRVPKSVEFSNVASQIGTAGLGNYIEIKEVTGTAIVDKGTRVQFYNAAANSITGKKWNNKPSGAMIGTGTIYTTIYGGGTPGTADGKMLVYLADISMNSGLTFANARSVFVDNYPSVANLVGDIILTDGEAKLKDAEATLLFSTGASATKTTRDFNGNPSFTYNFTKSSNVSVAGAGTFTLTDITTGSPDNEQFPYGTTSGLTDLDKKEITLTWNESFNVVMTGNVSSTGNTLLVGSGTTFTYLNVGDKLEFAGKSNTVYISSIVSGTLLHLTENAPSGLTGNSFFKAYKTGDIVDLSSKGATAGLERVVSATPTQLSFDLKETYGAAKSATVTFQVVRANVQESAKLRRSWRYVKINCASAGVSTEYNLGFSDVWRIRSITKKSGSFPTSVSDGVDVTSEFMFDNGQKARLYDHGKIIPMKKLETTDRLLVCLDYFQPDYTSGKGFFTVDSYPIDDDNPSSNTTIRTEELTMRNFIDIRPIKENTATDATTPGTASENPATTTSFNYPVNGMRLMAPSTQFTYDYSYYLARRDLLVMNKDGIISTIRGTPGVYPVTPTTPETVMALASLYIAPYPSLAPNYAKQIQRTNLGCTIRMMTWIRHTMREIGVMKQRINNLEYYASLSLLETQAAELKVLDENGLERFKNGIFCDNFTNHKLGDRRNPNYNIVVDEAERVIRPRYTMNSINYRYIWGNSNIKRSNTLITLDYTETPFIEQNVATSTRNVEWSSYRHVGTITLNPDMDVWVDTEYAPDEQIIIGEPKPNTSITIAGEIEWGDWVTEWNEWQTSVTGVSTSETTAAVSNYYTVGATYYDLPDASTFKFSAASDITATTFETLSAVTPAIDSYANAIDPGIDKIYNGTPSLSSSWGTAATYDIYSVTATTTTTNTTNTITTTGIQTGSTSREGQQALTTVSTESVTQSENIGTKVIDASLIPYIRPQVIRCYARGLRPSTKMFVFFDGEPMSNYSRPITQAMFELDPGEGGIWDTSVYTGSQEGDDIITDSDGRAYFELRLPTEKRFRVGSRPIVLTDSPTNSVDASTYADGYFVAKGLLQQKQNTILTTHSLDVKTSSDIITVTQSEDVVNTFTDVQVVQGPTTTTVTEQKDIVKTLTYVDVSCTAYSFIPKTKKGEDGVFITGFDLYFAAKSDTAGIWFEIREMNSAGGITRKQVPLSEVWLTPDQVNVSDDATAVTQIKFPDPIFLYNNTQYALVIHTEGIVPDYYLWVSRLGETNIDTGQPHTSRPLRGTYYTTNNNLNWNMVDDVDLKVTFYRAVFDTNVDGEFILGNRAHERMLVGAISDPAFSDWKGSDVIGTPRLTMASNTSEFIANDWIVGLTSGANSTIINVTSGVVSTSNINFQVNERVTIYRSNGYATGVESNVSSIMVPRAKLRRYKNSGNASFGLVELEKSNGEFDILASGAGEWWERIRIVDPATIDTASEINVSISSVQNQRYSVIDFEPEYILFNGTNVSFQMKTTSNATSTLGDYFTIRNNQNYYFNTEQAILSRTNEIADLSGQPSNNVKVSMRTTTDYLSPVFDLSRTHSVYIDNIINANTYKEDATGETITLSANGQFLNIGDYLVGQTSGANTQVIFNSGNTVSVVPDPAEVHFIEGESVLFYTSAFALKSNTATVNGVVLDRKVMGGGELINKYISIPVTLAEGQDAEDLIVFITGYRPPGTDIKIWARVVNVEDGGTPIEYQPWIELVKNENSPYSSLSNPGNYYEYAYRFSDSQRSGPNGEVQYKNAAGTTFTGFRTYAIKIGLLSTNSAIIPKVGDLRVIALQI